MVWHLDLWFSWQISSKMCLWAGSPAFFEYGKIHESKGEITVSKTEKGFRRVRKIGKVTVYYVRNWDKI